MSTAANSPAPATAPWSAPGRPPAQQSAPATLGPAGQPSSGPGRGAHDLVVATDGLTKTYGVTFGSFRELTGQALVQALKNGQVDAANIFSTDPSIAANDFVVLEDTKKLFGSQNVVPLVRSDVQEEVQSSLDEVSAKLTTDKLAELLKRTDIDKEDPDQVAADFLKEEGLD